MKKNDNNKRLFLLRHALSDSKHSDGDIARPLAEQGRGDAEALGQYMASNNFTPDMVLCSSADRTRETLKLLQLPISEHQISFLPILYSGTTGDYLAQIQKCNDEHNNVLLIGHNPSIYAFVTYLCSPDVDETAQRLSEGYHAGTLSVLGCKQDKWEDIQPKECPLIHMASPMDYNAPPRPTRWM